MALAVCEITANRLGAVTEVTTERTANARLIAAAPELLEALRDLLAEFDSYDKAMAEHGFGHEDYGQQRATARAAIAKAIGE